LAQVSVPVRGSPSSPSGCLAFLYIVLSPALTGYFLGFISGLSSSEVGYISHSISGPFPEQGSSRPSLLAQVSVPVRGSPSSPPGCLAFLYIVLSPALTGYFLGFISGLSSSEVGYISHSISDLFPEQGSSRPSLLAQVSVPVRGSPSSPPGCLAFLYIVLSPALTGYFLGFISGLSSSEVGYISHSISDLFPEQGSSRPSFLAQVSVPVRGSPSSPPGCLAFLYIVLSPALRG